MRLMQLLVTDRDKSHACRASASRGGAVHRRELRADREQPPVAVAGVVAAPVAQDQQGEAVRRRRRDDGGARRQRRRGDGGHPKQPARPADGLRRGQGLGARERQPLQLRRRRQYQVSPRTTAA